jgi:signal peptidase I
MADPEIKSSTPIDYTSPPATSPSPQTPPQETPEQTDPGTTQEENSSNSNIRSIISTIVLFLAAPILALVLILFVIQSYEVDGQSMETTLQNKDLLIVSKVPKTLSRITGSDYIPSRYTIIIFSRDESGGLGGQTRQLVKRVIAVPGERVVVNEGKVRVYNAQNPEGFDPDEGQEYSKSIKTTPGNVDITVQEGQVFALGDNRTNSLDSRFFGPVDSDDIVGRLGVRIFPLNKAQSF